MNTLLERTCVYEPIACLSSTHIWNIASSVHTVHLYINPTSHSPRRRLYSGIWVYRVGTQLTIQTMDSLTQ